MLDAKQLRNILSGTISSEQPRGWHIWPVVPPPPPTPPLPPPGFVGSVPLPPSFPPTSPPDELIAYAVSICATVHKSAVIHTNEINARAESKPPFRFGKIREIKNAEIWDFYKNKNRRCKRRFRFGINITPRIVIYLLHSCQ